MLSVKVYLQGDCKLFRFKVLSLFDYKQPMGAGSGETPPVPEKWKNWDYPPPNSPVETVLKKVCKSEN